jgi:putative DNA primase/helicase
MSLTRPIKIALGTNHIKASNPCPQTRDVELTPAEAGDLFTKHREIDDKLAAGWFCPGLMGGSEEEPIARGKASVEAENHSYIFILDFDAGVSVEDTKSYFEGFDHWGYSSHSYTERNQKHRVVIPLTRTITTAEYRLIFLALEIRLKQKLGKKALPDSKCRNPWQAIFLPSCPPKAERVSWQNDGNKDFPVEKLIADGRAIEARDRANLSAKLDKRKPVGDSVISRFNETNDLETLLEANGYERHPGGRYLAPNSQSGIPGVVILRDERGEVLCSHHTRETDPLAVGHVVDAFSVWCIMSGITSLAEGVRRAAELLGIQTSKASLDETEEESFESVFPPPKHTAEMFYGLIGELAEVGSRDKEVHPVAVALNALTLLSVAFGRDCFVMLGDTRHHCRIFGLHVGPTSRARKGDSRSFIGRVAENIASRDAGLLGHSHGGGLSSREGLIALIPDTHESGPVKRDGTRTIVEGERDKRLLVVESEFANVLNQSKRDGNTLSAAIRDAFDGAPLKPAIKTDSMGVAAPHVGIMANITPGELRFAASQNEVGNGFLNRFMMIYAARTRLIAWPKPTDRRFVEAYAVKVEEVVKFARGQYPDTSNSREMQMTDGAIVTYTEAYERGFLNQREVTGTIEALLERRPAYVVRLAMLFALTDKSLEIEDKHIRVALAWMQYVTESVRFIYSDGSQVRQQHTLDTNGGKIVEFLRGKASGASKTEISAEVFNRHLGADALDSSLRELMATTPPTIVQRVIPRPDGKPGRPKTVYVLTSEKYQGCEFS